MTTIGLDWGLAGVLFALTIVAMGVFGAVLWYVLGSH
jgi:hypothetical protein